MSLRILWTTPYLPWPTVGGNKVRQYQLLRCLAQRGHRITLLVQSKREMEPETQTHLEGLVERLIVLPRRARKSLLSLGAAAFSPLPVVVSVNGYSGRLHRAMATLLQERWDAVHVEHSYGLQSLLPALQVRHQRFALTEHNVESSLIQSLYYHPKLPNALLPLARRYDTSRYRRWEQRALAAATRVIAVTPEDAAAMVRISGRSVDVVPNGVDCEYFSQVQPDVSSQRLMLVGNMEYPPNADSVEFAMDAIMPLLWQRLPTAKVVVCGYAMPTEWRARWPDPRAEFLGFVDDLRVQQVRCAALLAPLRAGGGSKLKVIESMAAGLAVICTPQGVTGLDVQAGRDYRLGNSPQELVEQLVPLLQNPAALRQLGDNGRAYVRREHDWRLLTSKLEAIYREMATP